MPGRHGFERCSFGFKLSFVRIDGHTGKSVHQILQCEVERICFRQKRKQTHLVCRIIDQEIFLRSEEHTSELQSRGHLVCRLLLEKKKKNRKNTSMKSS